MNVSAVLFRYPTTGGSQPTPKSGGELLEPEKFCMKKQRQVFPDLRVYSDNRMKASFGRQHRIEPYNIWQIST